MGSSNVYAVSFLLVWYRKKKKPIYERGARKCRKTVSSKCDRLKCARIRPDKKISFRLRAKRVILGCARVNKFVYRHGKRRLGRAGNRLRRSPGPSPRKICFRQKILNLPGATRFNAIIIAVVNLPPEGIMRDLVGWRPYEII